MPAPHAPPTGPQTRLLRRMRSAPLVATRAGPGRVRCEVGGRAADSRLLAGLIDRGLVAERPAGDDRSEYTLTPEGQRWTTD